MQWRAVLGCGVALVMAACGGASEFRPDNSSSAGSAGASGSTSGGSAGSGGADSGGSGGTPTGGDGGTSLGGSGGEPVGGSGGEPVGGSGGEPAGGTGGIGGSETGGIGGGGVGGVPPVDRGTCEPDAIPTDDLMGDANVREMIQGTNGLFVDTCDDAGNLVQYLCQTEMICGDPPNPYCETFLTGEVESETLDCLGTCVDGRCAARCPDFGDQVTYLSMGAEGAATFQNEVDERYYSCDLIFEGGADCRSQGRVGTTHTIDSLGLRGGPCTGMDFGNIGLADCSYRCDILIAAP